MKRNNGQLRYNKKTQKSFRFIKLPTKVMDYMA